MTDELDRIRSLRDDAPAPSEDWVHRTRAELLELAAQEEDVVGSEAGSRSRLRRLLARWPRSPRPIAAAVAAVLAIVVVGVGVTVLEPPSDESEPPVASEENQPDPTPPAPADEPEEEPEDEGVMLAASCEGGGGAYTIRYPEGWHTNAGDVADGCQRFDEEPVELEAQTGGAPEQPVVARVLPVGLDVASDPGEAEQEAFRTQTTVAGRHAVVVEWTSTGAAGLPEGLRSYRYLIDLDGQRTLMVAAYDVSGGRFEELRDVVDAMVDSLEITDD